MYSSSASPTTNRSSDLVTRDRPAVDFRTGTLPDTTAGFSVGLIPQLTEILHVLTEGLDLLAHKVRAARHDESAHSTSHAEQLERVQIPTGPPVAGSGRATVETPRPPREDIEFDGEHTRADISGIGDTPDPGIDFGGADAPFASFPDSAPLSYPLEVTSAGAADEPSSGPVVQSMPLNATPPATTASPLRRDYNFFDELDARLASLQDPTG